MSAKNVYVRRYQYEFFGPDKKKPNKPIAAIFLYSDKNEHVASIFFSSEDEVRMPVEQNGMVIAHYSLATMNPIIDMLRNEKPVIFCWDDIAQTTRIASGNEPVGEEELKKMFSFLYM